MRKCIFYILSFMVLLSSLSEATMATEVMGKDNPQPDHYTYGMLGWDLNERAKTLSTKRNIELKRIADSLILLSKEKKFPLAAAHGYAMLADYYVAINMDSSLYYRQKKIEIAIKYDMEKCIFDGYYELCLSYLEFDSVDKAYSIYEKIHQLSEENNSDYGRMMTFYSLSDIYKWKNDRKTQKMYLEKTAHYLDSMDMGPKYNVYIQLSHLLRDNSNKKLEYLHKSLEYSKNTQQVLEVYMLIAQFYGRNNDPDNFYYYWEKYDSLSNANNITIDDKYKIQRDIYDCTFRGDVSKLDSLLNSIENKQEFNFYSYRTAYLLGDFPKAIKYLWTYYNYDDSVDSQYNEGKFAEYKLELYKIDLEKRKSERYTNIVMVLSICAFIIVILLMLIFKLKYSSLQKTENLKFHFLQSMDHEVKTPLNAISGYSQILGVKDSGLSPQERKTLSDHILSNVNILSMYIDDILRTSEVNSGNFVITLGKAKVNELCRNAISSSQHRVPAGVELKMETDLRDDYSIITDANRVQQILINLINNACKNTTQGYVMVYVTDSIKAGNITFVVEDTGVGIPPEMKEKIFKRAVKLNPKSKGSGLGLFICCDIATKLDGVIYLDTKYKNGARFVLSIKGVID